MNKILFFDNASTTRCCDAAVKLIAHFASEEFGNPSSSHSYGQQAASAIKDARRFFADTFKVTPNQIIFTGSGSESDNLAIYGVALDALVRFKTSQPGTMPRVLASSTEHPAVRKTVQSLSSLGIEIYSVPVDSRGQVKQKELLELLTPNTVLVSIHQVNNIVGSVLPIEELATLVKEKVPGAIFHSDCVQAFCRVNTPVHPSPVDLVSISAHKVEGPKGVGALVVLNPKLLKNGIRPLIWGGEQEGGFRSGTQSPGLISGFHIAAKESLEKREAYSQQTRLMRSRLKDNLIAKKLLSPDGGKSIVRWNSPDDGVPHIVNLSVSGYPSGPLAKLLEERGCLVSTGSACSSQKMEDDPVLTAMGLSPEISGSAIRISFSGSQTLKDVDVLSAALDESIRLMGELLGLRNR